MKKNLKPSPISIITRVLRMLINLIVALIVTAFQVAWLYFTVFYYYNIPYASSIVSVISICVALYIFCTHQNTSYKIIWIILIMVLPFAGTFFYLFYGYGKTAPQKLQRQADNIYLPLLPETAPLDALSNHVQKPFSAVTNLSCFPAYANSDAVYFSDGYPMYESLLTDLQNATKYIALESFIIAEGKMWESVKQILTERADNGVRVFILFDSIGSSTRIKTQSYLELSHHENIQIQAFNPLGLRITAALNYRDHRKAVIIDGKIAYIGGTNFADEYVHFVKRFGYWRDCGAKMTGDCLKSYVLMFCQNWYMATKKPFDYDLLAPAEASNVKSEAIIQPFGDTPADKKDPAYNCIMSLIENAQDYLYMSTPYLIIDNEMSNTICRAKSCGVDVKILVPGIPDKKLVYCVTRSHYRRLLQYGVEIYEYCPGFNHSKQIVSDDKISLIGSINLDYRSLLLNYESGTLIASHPCVTEIKADFLAAVDKSERITLEMYNSRPLRTRLKEYLLSFFSPLF